MNLPSRASAPVSATFYFDFADVGSFIVAESWPRARRTSEVALHLEGIDAHGLAARAPNPISFANAAAVARRLGLVLPAQPPKPPEARIALEACAFVRDRSGQEAMEPLASGLWRALWREGRAPNLETVLDAASDVAVSRQALEEGLRSGRGATLLDRATERARASGLPALPAIDLEGYRVAGFDRCLAVLDALTRGAGWDAGASEDAEEETGLPDWIVSG